MVKEFVLIEHGEYNRLKDNPSTHDNEIDSNTAPGTSMLSAQHLLSTVKSKVGIMYHNKVEWLFIYLVSYLTVVERLLGLLNYLKLMKNCVPIHLRNSFGFMVLNNQICLELLKKFGPLVNVNLLKVFLKT